MVGSVQVGLEKLVRRAACLGGVLALLMPGAFAAGREETVAHTPPTEDVSFSLERALPEASPA